MQLTVWQQPGRNLSGKITEARAELQRLEDLIEDKRGLLDGLVDNLTDREFHVENLKTLSENCDLPENWLTGTDDEYPLGTKYCLQIGGCSRCPAPGEECPGNNAETRALVYGLVNEPAVKG